MKKIFSVAIIGIISCMLIFSFAACSTKNISKITDMERFSDMQKKADRIDVEFDNHSGKAFLFSIEKTDDISEILDLLFEENLIKLNGEFPPGDNTYLIIIQDEKEYRLSVRVNKEKKNYYAFETNTLQTKIADMAREKGAYEGVE